MDPDRFIRKVCHDLRAPLRALKELPDWLEEDLRDQGVSLTGDMQDNLEMMKRQAHRMDLIVEGLGRYARLERGGGLARTDVARLVAEVVDQNQVRVVQRVETLALEPDHARLIIENLVSNAVTHGGRDDLVLTISAKDNMQCIRMSDAGPGIPRDQEQTVFEPLSALQPRDVQEGAGMGLAIVARLAQMYGGSSTCSPNPAGKGAVFDVIWPVGQARD